MAKVNLGGWSSAGDGGLEPGAFVPTTIHVDHDRYRWTTLTSGVGCPVFYAHSTPPFLPFLLMRNGRGWTEDHSTDYSTDYSTDKSKNKTKSIIARLIIESAHTLGVRFDCVRCPDFPSRSAPHPPDGALHALYDSDLHETPCERRLPSSEAPPASPHLLTCSSPHLLTCRAIPTLRY